MDSSANKFLPNLSFFYLIDHLKAQQTQYNNNLAFPPFTGSEIPPIEPLPPAPQSQRPQRNAGIPQWLEGCEVTLPLRRVGSVQLPITLHDPVPTTVQNPPEPMSNYEFCDASIIFIRESLKLSIKKLEKYVALMERSPAYWAAMVLHPGLRSRWIDRNLEKEQGARVISQFRFSDAVRLLR